MNHHRTLHINPNRGQLAKRLAITVIVLALHLFTIPVLYAQINVTTAAISSGDGNCDLVDAITTANTGNGVDTCTGVNAGGANTITFDNSLTTITLNAINNSTAGKGANGLPVIISNITIDGGTGGITITRDSSAPAFRILEIQGSSGGQLTLDNMTIHNGKTSGPFTNNATNADDAKGGGIYLADFAALTLLRGSAILSNTANHNGGGVFADNNSPITIDSSTVQDNVSIRGGGIYANLGSTVTIDNSKILSNTALTIHGGGLYANKSDVIVRNSSVFQNNRADDGGGGLFVQVDSSLPMVALCVIIKPFAAVVFTPIISAP